jgi:chromosome segregation ATPase
MPDISDISSSLENLERELSKLRSASRLIHDAEVLISQNIDVTQKLSANLAEETKKTQDFIINNMTKTREISETLVKTINEYKIPFHFQQLDTDISKVDTKIDDLQIRVTSLEKSIMDRIESKVELVSGRIKKTVTIQYVVLFLILLVSVSLLILQLFGY